MDHTLHERGVAVVVGGPVVNLFSSLCELLSSPAAARAPRVAIIGQRLHCRRSDDAFVQSGFDAAFDHLDVEEKTKHAVRWARTPIASKSLSLVSFGDGCGVC